MSARRCNHRHALTLADETIGRLKAENTTLAAERDVWSGAACLEEQAQGNSPCGGCRVCLPARVKELEAERDAALKRCDKLEAFISYIESPALKAWRALDAEVRFAARRGLFVAGHNEAAAALEALGEKA